MVSFAPENNSCEQNGEQLKKQSAKRLRPPEARANCRDETKQAPNNKKHRSHLSHSPFLRPIRNSNTISDNTIEHRVTLFIEEIRRTFRL